MDWAFGSFAEFLAMGKHGVFVWWSVVLSLLGVFGLLIPEWLGYRRSRRRLIEQNLLKAAHTKPSKRA